MCKNIITLMFLLVHLWINAQPSQVITPIKSSTHNMFELSQKDISHNQVDYRLFIAVPKCKTQKPHPVLYMLDGNGQFPLLLNQIDSVDNQTPIIVGIGYQSEKAYPKERTRDYTIHVGKTNGGGGAESFYQFIQDIVKSYIQSIHMIDTTKQTICGHSLGGLFTLYVLFNHNHSFQHYISGSPSLWWDNGAIIPTHRPLFDQQPKSVHITLGQYEEDPKSDPSRKELSPELLAKKEARKSDITTRELFRTISEEVQECSLTVFERKNHGSSVSPFLIKALNVASQ